MNSDTSTPPRDRATKSPNIPGPRSNYPSPDTPKTNLIDDRRFSGGADLLAVGFGTATVMWMLGYVLHMPVIAAPGAVTFAGLLLVLAGGGFKLGRRTTRGFGGALVAALITTTVNLLVLGSLVADAGENPSPALWLPGYYVGSVAVMLIGFALGRAMRPQRVEPLNWRLRFAAVAALATGLVVTAGGLVTGFDAGFAVPDWPTSYSLNMFAFPLSRMTGGIYYEHAHRLAGTLVGLTAIVLMIYLLIIDPRKWVKALSVVALLMVCAQGVAGGVWVLEAELAYVLFHGTFGQIILATFTVLAATQSRTWRDAQAKLVTPSASLDRSLATTLLIVVLLQISLGVALRKANLMLIEHITMAAVVATLATIAGGRAWLIHSRQFPLMRRIGFGILHIVLAQLALGIIALMARSAANVSVKALITTLHQVTGAALLAMTALLAAWTYRLLKRQPQQEAVPSGAGPAGAGPA